MSIDRPSNPSKRPDATSTDAHGDNLGAVRDELTKPTPKPADATAKPADATAKPADATAKPADATAKPADATAKPADATPKPAEAADHRDVAAPTDASQPKKTPEQSFNDISKNLFNADAALDTPAGLAAAEKRYAKALEEAKNVDQKAVAQMDSDLRKQLAENKELTQADRDVI
ncbi:MAG TPA: hypothetical protein V6C72_03605, partial [Chroococcales cyanobacterium]